MPKSGTVVEALKLERDDQTDERLNYIIDKMMDPKASTTDAEIHAELVELVSMALKSGAEQMRVHIKKGLKEVFDHGNDVDSKKGLRSPSS